ncbi:MAG: hypothetical protein KDD94_07130, partial [Calditrichaeota bacterium]|nr:hypothetical protein [Calditrichota bacterium]
MSATKEFPSISYYSLGLKKTLQMKALILVSLICHLACSGQKTDQIETLYSKPDDLLALLDTIYQSEQEPIRLRDAYINAYGAESEQAKEQQLIYEKNHAVNERKI